MSRCSSCPMYYEPRSSFHAFSFPHENWEQKVGKQVPQRSHSAHPQNFRNLCYQHCRPELSAALRPLGKGPAGQPAQEKVRQNSTPAGSMHRVPTQGQRLPPAPAILPVALCLHAGLHCTHSGAGREDFEAWDLVSWVRSPLHSQSGQQQPSEASDSQTPTFATSPLPRLQAVANFLQTSSTASQSRLR